MGFLTLNKLFNKYGFKAQNKILTVNEHKCVKKKKQ